MNLLKDNMLSSKDNFNIYLEEFSRSQPDNYAFIFLADGETESERLTYAELDLRARLIATQLQSQCQPGDRALLCYPPGLEFICAFMGCLYAGVIAVPAFPVRNNRHAERLWVMVEDCDAAVILSTTEVIEVMRRYERFHDAIYVATEELSVEALSFTPFTASEVTLAFLQYTSGSTGNPKGVMVSHSNILHNVECMEHAFAFTDNRTIVCWLPVQHDMSLVANVLLSIYLGGTCVMMAPTIFLERPLYWLKAISQYGAHYAAAPNFAYELCVKKWQQTPLPQLNLSRWRSALNGSEPIRAETLRKFADTFGPNGFALDTFCPGYGMAEVTLLLTGRTERRDPIIRMVSGKALGEGFWQGAEEGTASSRWLVSSGQVLPEHESVVIVEPETFNECASERVGEIWIKSKSVAQGYWSKPELTEEIFQAHVSDGRGPYLRTGDLGILYEGELYITGRLKDLIIIQGRNIYPQDIEAAVEGSHAAIRLDCTAVFSVENNGEERIVVVAEIERTARKQDPKTILAAMRKAVIDTAEVVPYSLVLLQPAQALKTTSGKIQRQATKRAYLAGELQILAEDKNIVAESESGSRDYSNLAADLQSLYQKILEIETLNPNDKFSSLGGDSLKATELYDALQKYLGRSLPLSSSVAFDYPSLAELTNYIESLVKGTPSFSRSTFTETTLLHEPIAIIGMSCRFPGSGNSDTFWELLQAGKTAVGPIPQNRSWLNNYLEEPGYGGFIENIEYFDAGLFNITPREAERMDPQQRILLEVTWEAFESAGIAPRSMSGSATGIFIGAVGSEYKELLLRSGEDVADAYFATGNDISVIAGRIAYTFGLQGPTLTIDTACSSSLVAIHEACKSLRDGECTLALAGGVNALLSADEYEALTKAQMLAPDGSCKTFDKEANGYVRGEGCGVIILKRLSDAVRDNDRILAVIKGSAVNQDGASSGLTVPNGLAQEQLLDQALIDARLTPKDIDYIETHGTGTRLGDPMEVNAINRVYAGSRAENSYLYLGAVKTNIGHLEAAAGIASVIKTILALEHESIPPNLHFSELNPQIDLTPIPAQLPLQAIDWKKQSGKIRRVGVSSFGFSGTNAHIILEESPEHDESQVRQPLPPYAFQRERYWFTVSHRKVLLREQSTSLHPFLGNALDSPALTSIIYESWLSPDEIPLLNDHVFYGVPIFAFAAYVSTAIELIAQTQRFHHIDILNLSVELPLLFDKQESRRLQTIVATENWQENKISMTMQSRSANNPGEWEAHFSASLLTAEKAPNAESIAIDELKSRSTQTIAGDTLYNQLLESGVALGPGFRWLEEVYVGEGFVLGHLKIPEVNYLGEAVRPSGFLDAGFMLGATRCLQEKITSQVFVPIYVRNLSLTLDSPLAKWVYVKMLTQEAEQHSCEIRWLNDQGDCLDVMPEVNFRYAPKERLLETLLHEKSPEECLYVTAWHKEVLPTPTSPLTGDVVWFSPAGAEPYWLDPNNLVNLITVVAGAEWEASSHRYVINSAQPEDYARLLTEFAGKSIRFIYDGGTLVSNDTWDPGAEHLLRLLQAISIASNIAQLHMYVLTQEGLLLPGRPVSHLSQTPISALLKTAQLENPLLRFTQIEGSIESTAISCQLLALPQPENFYVIDAGECYVPRLMESRKASSLDMTQWRVGTIAANAKITAGGYLITGATGALGLAVAKWLVEKGATTVWLLARSVPNSTTLEIIEKLAQTGAEIITLQADVGQKIELESAFAHILAHTTPLQGVFHLAGILDDVGLADQTSEHIATVWQAKARGAWYLHELTQSLPLNIFVMFSSVAAVLGSVGQANYAMANAYLDGLANYRQQKGLPALTVAWGPWADSGMAAGLAARMQKLGIQPLATDFALVLLTHALASSYFDLLALDINWSRLAKERLQVPAWLSDVMQAAIEPKGEWVLRLEDLPTEERQASLSAWVMQALKETLGMAPSKTLNAEDGFFSLGMDSLMAMDLRNRLQMSLGSDYPLAVAELFNYASVRQLSEFLAQRIGLEGLHAAVAAPVMARVISADESVAVVGMGCRFPGGANSPEQFWELLKAGYDGIRDVPKDRWDMDDYYDPDPKTPGKMQVRKGGFLDFSIADWDANFFKTSPRQAEMMDPQQRLILEVTVEALEDAGIPMDSLRGTETGVFVGVWHSDYGDLLTRYAGTEGVNQFTNSTTLSATAGLVSFYFGLMGPCYAVDTACSSSLVALDGAMKALRRGECQQAIVVGSNLLINPDVTIGFDKAGMLSPDGYCKTFDESANGYVRGEGIGVVILKPLQDAISAGDRIYGVIKSSRINHNGPASGITVPNGVAQANLIRYALQEAQVAPEEIDYIEAHGTGTALGDPIEVSAIESVFRETRDKHQPLLLGSVKSNIGHLEAAAGVAGLIKVLLSLQHETLPPNIHFNHPNTKMNLDAIPATVPTICLPWNRTSYKRRLAGVSSFGATGINAHVIIEEAPLQDPSTLRAALPKTIFNRQHYWAEALTHKRKENMYGEEIHPLLGYRLTGNATQSDIIYEHKIDLNEESVAYLGDHQVYEHVLYPASGYIELLLRVTQREQEPSIELSKFSIERLLAFTAKRALMEVVVNEEKVSIYSESEAGWVLHSTATMELHPTIITETKSFSELESSIRTKVAIKDFYEKAQAMGLQYGPAFHVIKQAKIEGHEALVYLETAAFDARYLAYPALVDGGLQGLGLWGETSLYLPVSCEQIIWQQTLPSHVVAHIELLEKTHEGMQANIHFYADEVCVLQLKGFRARRASKNAFLKMLAQKEEKIFYQPVWDSYTPELGGTAKEVLVYDARTNTQDISVAPALSLLSYLQKQLSKNANVSGLHIITENAYGDTINLNQSSLNGLIKTAILEHPELHIRQLDVPQDIDVTPLLEIVAKDLGNAQILQYREEKWLSEYIAHQRGLALPNGDYRLVKSESGIIEQVILIDEDTLSITDNEMLITPKAVGLNFRDVLNAMNLYPGDPGPLGGDVSGIIKAVGKNITGYQVGDEVVGLALGSLASQAITQEALITLKPKTLQFSEAATIPTVFMTAYLALVKLAKLKADETVLIHAGTGGVGLAAIQIAQYCKAKIIATAGSEKKREYLQSLGIEHVFDSRSLSYKDDILRVTHNHGVDVVLNSLSGKGFIEATLESSAENARFVEIGKRDIWSSEEVHAKRNGISYHILALDQLSIEHPEEVQELLQAVMQLFEKKILKPIPQTSFPLSQAVDAFKYLQLAKQIGKVVITLPAAEIEFKGNASYLITGGLGGVGLEVANYLREHGAKRIILIGRHAPNEIATTRIEEIRASGIEVVTTLCDVSVASETNSLIKDISTKEYPLKGIFHLAGIIEDAPLDKQTESSFTHVFAPKALGAWNLHEATKDINLDYFVLFSSIASLNGSSGQSNYAVANGFLDGLAAYRQQRGLVAQSVNWGPWREVGMAKELVANHERQGLKPLGTEEALVALSYVLKQPLVELGIIHADWKKVGAALVELPSWLDMLVEQKETSDFLNIIKLTPPEQREALLKETITQEVKKVLGQTLTPDDTKGFFDMGMDSLMALELKNRLQAHLGVSMPNTIAFDYPSIEQLMKNITTEIMPNVFINTANKIEEPENLEKYLSMNDVDIDKLIDGESK